MHTADVLPAPPTAGRQTTGGRLARVVVADDHEFFRDGLVRGLSRSGYLQVVGEAGTGREAIDLIRRERPDVAVVDYQMPDLDGLDVVHAVGRDGLDTRVVILSAVDDGAVVFRALEAGARGYLSKDARRGDVIDAVRRVSRGETVVPAALAAGLARQIRQQAHTPDVVLSAREREVLDGFARGLSIPRLAGELYLGASTVKTHTQRLYEKLGVSDRAAAVAEGMRRGLVE
jgi:two-component system nitrate/nitrite response regulator NarL